MLVFFLSLNGKAIYAASASVAFSATSSEFVVGDSFVVTLTAESSSGISGFQTYVAYDTSVLELVDMGNHVSGGDGLIFIHDLEGSEQVREYHMKFKALQPASTEVYVSDTIYMYSGDTAESMSVSKNTLKLNIKEQAMPQSTNKGLASLAVSEGELTPAFDPDILNYELQVGADTTRLYIDAKAKLKAYTVRITGNDNLQAGENKVSITVTAKNEEKKVYTISVHKRTQEEETLLQEDQEMEEELPQSSDHFQVYEENGNTYVKSEMELEIVPIPDVSVIPEGYVENTIVLEGQTIPAYVPEIDTASDFVLLYGRVGEGAAKFYVFDRIGETIQRYNESKDQMVSHNTQESAGKTTGGKVSYMICFLLVVAVLVLGLRVIHLKKKLLEIQEYEPDMEDTE